MNGLAAGSVTGNKSGMRNNLVFVSGAEALSTAGLPISPSG
jgi:hypothetical protein